MKTTTPPSDVSPDAEPMYAGPTARPRRGRAPAGVQGHSLKFDQEQPGRSCSSIGSASGGASGGPPTPDDPKPEANKRARRKRDGKNIGSLDLNVVEVLGWENAGENATWEGFRSALRSGCSCLAGAQTMASTEMWHALSMGSPEPLGTVAYRTASPLLPCLPGCVVAATTRQQELSFRRTLPEIKRHSRVLPTFRSPAPYRVPEHDWKIEGKAPVAEIVFPIRTARLCPRGQEYADRLAAGKYEGPDQVPLCARAVRAAEDRKLVYVRVRAISDGANAIATLRRLLEGRDGHERRSLMLLPIKGKTKIIAKVTYEHPKVALSAERTHVCAMVRGWTHLVYAVSDDGAAFGGFGADPLLRDRRRFSAARRTEQRAAKYASDGARGHGHDRLLREVERSQGRETRWARDANYRAAGEFSRWCAEHGIGHVILADGVPKFGRREKIPAELKDLLVRWPWFAIGQIVTQVLARDGVAVEEIPEPTLCCPVCDGNLEPDKQIARCKSCGFVRQRAYARCVNLLVTSGHDVRPIIQMEEDALRSARKRLRAAEQGGSGQPPLTEVRGLQEAHGCHLPHSGR
jgi:hypothetical protein